MYRVVLQSAAGIRFEGYARARNASAAIRAVEEAAQSAHPNQYAWRPIRVD